MFWSRYIDNVIAAGKAQHTHQFIKNGIIPQGAPIRPCSFCDAAIDEGELLNEITIENNQILVNSVDTLKQKLIYIAGFLVHRHGQPDFHQGEEELLEFLTELS